MKICNNCRQSNPSEAMFCRQCASPLTGGQQQQQQQYGNPQNQFGQQQWNQANYGNQNVQQQNFGQPAGASSRASTAAILSFAGLFCCGLLAFGGAIMGWLEIQAIKEGKSSPAGMGMAQMGLWVGVLTIILNVVGGVIFVLLGALGSI